MDELQSDLGCDSRSQLIELLVISQRHAGRDVWAILNQRSPRGRRWPLVLADDAVLPPEG